MLLYNLLTMHVIVVDQQSDDNDSIKRSSSVEDMADHRGKSSRVSSSN